MPPIDTPDILLNMVIVALLVLYRAMYGRWW